MQLHFMCSLKKARIISVQLNLTQEILCRNWLTLSVQAVIFLLFFYLLHGTCILTRI